MTTGLSITGLPITLGPAIEAKPVPGLPTFGTRIAEFDTWRPGYAGMSVEVLIANTTERAPLYSTSLLTEVLANPQVLLSKTDTAGIKYGKWAQPVYTTVPYRLLIDSTGETGIERPAIVELAGQDASLAVVESTRGGYGITLGDLADLAIHASLYGAIGGDSGTAVSTATLEAAIGAAAAQEGGYVQLPAGTIEIEPITLPQGVRLRGHGRSATILVCRDAVAIITLGGDGAGLEALTLDGQISRAASIGVHGHNVSQPHMQDVLITRFDVGTSFQGAQSVLWHNVSWSDCRVGLELLGDSDSSGESEGAEVANVQIIGGSVSLCVEAGVLLQFVDLPVREVRIAGMGFSTCVGPGLKLKGARGITIEHCYWLSNTASILVVDGDDLQYRDLNTTERVTFRGGRVDSGTITFDGTCQNVRFVDVDFVNIDFVMDVPTNAIVLENCIEDAATSSTGDTKKLARQSSFDKGEWVGITTDANPIVAWEMELQPGEVGLFEAKAIANARNDVTYGVFWIVAGAARPGGTLNFNLQTGNYAAGLVVTGSNSGASARITAVTQSAGSGTLTLRDITGTFISGELITDTATGSARVSGSLGTSSAALDGTGSDPVRADTITGSGWDMVFDVSGSMVQLKVTGESAKTIDWTVHVERLTS